MMNLRDARKHRGWNQEKLAHRLGVSQTLVSLWEQGVRKPPAKRLLQLRQLGWELDPTQLPLREDRSSHRVDFAQELANLGYPGFSHFRKDEPTWNPAEFLVEALSQSYLDRRTAEGLPWVAFRYSQLDWDWVRRESKLRDLQNRLGFTISLARTAAIEKKLPEVANRLEAQEEALRGSLLAKEDTYCNERMTTAERKWLQTHRPPAAAAWHVLCDLIPAELTHI